MLTCEICNREVVESQDVAHFCLVLYVAARPHTSYLHHMFMLLILEAVACITFLNLNDN
jgi:hypothetical protein